MKQPLLLTRKLLNYFYACEDGIQFCERNQLFGFDLNNIHEIKGDYLFCVSWVLGNILRYDTIELDHKGNVIKAHNSTENQLMTSAYDDNDKLLKYTRSKNGMIVANDRYEYDNSGKLIMETDVDGHYVRYSYTPSGLVKNIFTSASNNVDYFEYDYADNLIHQYDDFGYFIKKEYNLANKVTKETTILGSITYKYDKNNNLTQEINSSGLIVNYEYDKHNRLIREFDNQNNTTFKYREDGSLLSKIYTSYNFETTTVYDSHMNVAQSTKIRLSEEGNKIIEHFNNVFQYYPNGQLKKANKMEIPLI
jgi:YD repeat-containing protein